MLAAGPAGHRAAGTGHGSGAAAPPPAPAAGSRTVSHRLASCRTASGCMCRRAPSYAASGCAGRARGGSSCMQYIFGVEVLGSSPAASGQVFCTRSDWLGLMELCIREDINVLHLSTDPLPPRSGSRQGCNPCKCRLKGGCKYKVCADHVASGCVPVVHGAWCHLALGGVEFRLLSNRPIANKWLTYFYVNKEWKAMCLPAG